MGNILSYFFPQPTPASIEQVVEEITEDVATIKEASEEVVIPTPEVVGMIGDAKTDDLVERDFEVVEELAEQTNEAFEFVEEDKLENVSNVLNEGKHDLQEEIISNKVASLEATEVEIIGSVKDSDEGAQGAATPEPIREEASEAVDNSVNQDNENMSEVEMIGSIQESNVELVEETTTESVDLPTSEPVEPPVPGDKPIKVSTPEPLMASTPEPSKAPTEPSLAPESVGALTPEAIIISNPEPTKETTPDPTIQDSSSTSNPELIEVSPPEPLKAATPDPLKDSTPEPASATEPVKALTPEAIIGSTPEPTKAPSPEPNIQDSTIALNTDLIEAFPPEPLKDSTPEPQTAPTTEPSSDPEPVKAFTPEVIIVSTPEPEPAQAPTSELNIEEKNVKNEQEELSGGASRLKDLLKGSNDLNEE